MVKLIASDLDGTILRKGAQSVEPSTIKVIEQLVNKGMYFAPASGRQIVSLKRLFEPVSDKLVYIAERMEHYVNIRVRLLPRHKWIESLLLR